ncbi:MAG: PAS domain S-box protein [Bacteroidales bacterium]|nr:PAS domain S-box protein [Bacteroidales bacterium]
MKTKLYYQSKRAILAISTCIIFIAALIYLVIWNTKSFKEQTIKNSEQELSIKANIIVDNMKKYFFADFKDVEFFANTEIIKNSILKRTSHSLSPDVCLLEEYFSHHSKHINAITLIDAEGKMFHRHPLAGDTIIDYSLRKDVNHVLKYKKPHVSNVFSNLDGKLSFSLSQPVFSNDKFIGIMRFTFYLETIEKIFMAPFNKDNQFAILTNENGTLMSEPDKYIKDLIFFNRLDEIKKNYHEYDKEEKKEMLKKIIQGEKNISTVYSIDNKNNIKKHISALMPIKLYDKTLWVIVNKDYESILIPFDNYKRRFHISVLVIVFLFSIIAYFLFNISKKHLKLKKETDYLRKIAKNVEEITNQRNNFSSLNEEYEAQNEELKTISKDLDEKNEKLAKSEANLCRAQEVAHIGSWQLDFETNIEKWSDENYKIFGIPISTEITPDDFRNFIHPDDKSKVSKDWENGIKTGYYNNEARIIVKGKIKWIKGVAEFSYDDNNKPVSVIGVTYDITEQKEAKEKLIQKNIELNSFINNIPDMAWLKDKDSNFILANKAFGDAVGMNTEYLISQTCEVCFGKEAAENFKKDDRKVMENRKQIRIEESIKDAQGKTIYLETIKSPIFNESGDVKGTVGIARDITERKQAEKALQQSEEKYRTLVESLEEGIGNLDEKENFIFVNRAATKILGYSKEELLEKNLRELTTPEEFKKVLEQTSIRKTGKTSRYEMYIIRKNGEKRVISITASPIIDDDGKYKGAFGIFHDITEHKQAEKALRESEEKYRTLTETISDVIFTLDLEGKFTYFSPRFEELTAYSANEFIGKPFTEIIAPEYHELTVNSFRKGLDGEKTQAFEIEFLFKDGRRFPFEINPSSLFDANGQIIGRLGVARDITERKQAEMKLRESEEQFRTMVEHANDMIWTLNTQGHFTFYNHQAEIITGHKFEDWNNKKYNPLIHPDDVEIVNTVFIKTLSGESQKYTVRVIKENNEISILSVNTAPIYKKGKISGTVSFGRDITKRKQAEEALHESEEKYRLLAETAKDVILLLDLKGNIKYVNKEGINFTGYSEKEALQKNIRELLPADQIHDVNERFAKRKKGEASTFIYETVCCNKKGEKFPIEVKTTLIIEHGKPSGVLVLARDITERKKTEEEIRKLSKAVETTPQAIVITNMEGTIEYVNNGLLIIGDYEDDSKIVGQSVLMFSNNKGKKLLQEKVIPEILAGKNWQGEIPVKRRNGSIFPAEMICSVIHDENEKPKYMLSHYFDITERKKAEEQLNKYKIMVESSNDAMFIKDLESRYILINKKTLELFGNPPFEEIINKTDTEVMPDEDARHNINDDQKVFKTGKTKNFIKKNNLNGKDYWFYTTKIPLKDEKGNIIGLVAIARDITEQKQAEQEIKKISTAIEQSPAIIVITDLDSNIEYVNPQFCNITGYNVNEVVGKDFSFLKSDKYNEDFYNDLQQTIKSGKTWKGEFYNKKKNGEYYWENATISPVKNEKNEIVNFIKIAEDITKQKLTERALKTSEKRLKLAMEATNDGLWDLNTKTMEVNYFSPKYFTMLDYFPNELPYTYETWINLLHPDDRDNAKKNMKDYINEKCESYNIEFRMRTKKGKYKWILSRGEIVEYDINKNPARMIGTHVDITERKQTEQEINKILTAIEQSPAIVVITDLNANIEYVNPQFCNLTGYNIDEVIKQNPRILKSNLHPEVFYSNIWKTIKSGKTWKGEFYNKKKTGEYYWEKATIAPVKNEKNEIVNYVKIAEDITKQKETIKALKESEEKFRLLYENSNDAILLMIKDRFIACNQKTLKIFDCKIEQIIGKTPYDFSPVLQQNGNKSKGKAFENINKVLLDKEVDTFEWKHTKYDGTPFDAEVNLSRIIIDNTVLIQAIVRDVSKRKEAEKQLRLTQFAVDNSVEYIFIMNTYANFIYANKATIKTLGYSMKEFLQISLQDIDLNYKKGTWTKVYNTICKKGSLTSESTHCTKTGKKFPVEISFNLFTFENKSYIYAFIRDITERKEHERKLLDAIIKTEEKERKRFAEDLHDELGPLLSSVKYLVGILPDAKNENEKKTIIEKSNVVINAAISGVREISNNISPYILTNFGLFTAVKSFCDKINVSKALKIKFVSNIKEIRFKNNIEIAIYRIIVELMNNTVKYAKADKINILINIEENILSVLYKDNGIGFKTDDKTRKHEKGMGLKNINSRIKSLGGKLEINSKKNKGVEVKITIAT